MRQVSDAKQKTNRVQNVGLAASVQSSNCIEQGIESVDFRPLSVRLESIDDDGFDEHDCGQETKLLYKNNGTLSNCHLKLNVALKHINFRFDMRSR